jgi:hypothetical protein
MLKGRGRNNKRKETKQDRCKNKEKVLDRRK